MDFQKLARRRYSCRNYLNQPVEDEKVVHVLDTARLAPSAKNLQPWHFVVIEDPDSLAKIRSCYAGEWLNTAPMIIVACGDHKGAWYRLDGKNHTDIDLAIAIDHLTLAATDIGLATCWICNFNVMKCAKILQLPEGVEPIAMIPLGYPADHPDTSRHNIKRKKLDELVHKRKFYYKYFKR
ncbi:MAG: nitroreductase family protein [Bacteroidales bacterium]|nr:nitroreductase family protein [Bacteroidales bacterium]